MVRKAFHSRMQYLKENVPSVVTIQAHWKGHRQQKAYKERLEYLKQQMAVAIKVREECSTTCDVHMIVMHNSLCLQ